MDYSQTSESWGVFTNLAGRRVAHLYHHNTNSTLDLSWRDIALCLNQLLSHLRHSVKQQSRHALQVSVRFWVPEAKHEFAEELFYHSSLSVITVECKTTDACFVLFWHLISCNKKTVLHTRLQQFAQWRNEPLIAQIMAPSKECTYSILLYISSWDRNCTNYFKYNFPWHSFVQVELKLW